MNRLTKLTWITLFLPWLCLSPCAASPTIGETPPLLQASELLQAPVGIKMDTESLHGKVVVLEFWATWCGPCVAAIPHLNELAEKFKGQPVQFIAITAENKTIVENFLMKRPIKAWIALDTNKVMNSAYAITGIPHTVVLDKSGKIAAITYPTSLTEQHINDLLTNKRISIAVDNGAIVAAKNEKEVPPLFQVLIQPSNYTNTQGCSWGGGRMTATGFTIKELLPTIFNTHDDRIITNTPLPTGRFDFKVIQPHTSEMESQVLLQEAIKLTFGLTARHETNQATAFILKTKNINALGLKASPTKNMAWLSNSNSMKGVGVSSQSLASFLETKLETPVLDETGLTNSYGYDINLKWKQKSPDKTEVDALKKAVQEQLGLELVSAQCPVEMLVVDQVKKTNLEEKY